MINRPPMHVPIPVNKYKKTILNKKIKFKLNYKNILVPI